MPVRPIPAKNSILIDSYVRLRSRHPELFLVLAPRDSKRASEDCKLWPAEHGLTAALRSAGTFQPADIFILDTIGELIDFYGLADLAFVGGSLVSKGGHNPIEPAAMAIPVLFGPHMEDFSEIAESLIAEGGADKIGDAPAAGKGSCRSAEPLGAAVPDGSWRPNGVCLRQHDIIARHLLLIDRLSVKHPAAYISDHLLVCLDFSLYLGNCPRPPAQFAGHRYLRPGFRPPVFF